MKFIILFLLITSSLSYSAEICSRIAKINFQEVLVDAGDGRKAEGLRFYLEKDPIAKNLLNEYQKINRPSIWSVATSTLGSVMILTGIFQTGESNASNKNNLIFAGAAIIGINYLINKTISQSSEKILNKAVEQYNKRNLPKIYFNPYIDNSNNLGGSAGLIQRF